LRAEKRQREPRERAEGVKMLWYHSERKCGLPLQLDQERSDSNGDGEITTFFIFASSRITTET